jgi:hypothetical protein
MGLPRDDPGFPAWHQKHAIAIGIATGVVSAAFGIGFSIDQPVLVTALGGVGSIAAIAAITLRKTT